MGSSSDEGQHFIRSALTASDYVQHARNDYGTDAEKFIALYSSDSDQSAKVSQQHQFADRTALAERSLAADITKTGARVFLYYFAYSDGGEYHSEPPTLGLRLGADHGAELPYVFGLLNHWKTAVPEDDLKLQNVMMSYWANFARNLDPNGKGLRVWNPFKEADRDVMVLDRSVACRCIRGPRSSILWKRTRDLQRPSWARVKGEVRLPVPK